MSFGRRRQSRRGKRWLLGHRSGKRTRSTICRLPFARATDLTGPVGAALASADLKTIYAPAQVIEQVDSQWKTYKLTLTSNATDPKAKLVIGSWKPGTLWIDMVSLFPHKTFKDRPNGMRLDLATMLENLHPSFVRFPGGCWVEGETLETAMRWKRTIGDLSQTAQPMEFMAILFHQRSGISRISSTLRGSWRGAAVCDQLRHVAPGTTVAANEHEGCRGICARRLGRHRICQRPGRQQMGCAAGKSRTSRAVQSEIHGNRQRERRAGLQRALRLVLRCHKGQVSANEPDCRRMERQPNSRPWKSSTNIITTRPEFFINNANKYDSYDRKGYKVYVGEYAVTQNYGATAIFSAAVGEAAFMTGMERNSDVVVMASYAPLFVNVNDRRWNPDLIQFDSSRACGIPSYYVQQMFSQNRGDVVLPIDIENPAQPVETKHGAIGLGTWTTQAEYKDIKVTKGDKTLFTSDFSKDNEGWKTVRGQWNVKDGALQQTVN